MDGPGKLLILEGNIGVGKTTLAQRLAEQLDYKLVLEPMVQNPYLDLFYRDPKKYALKLQIWIYRQRYLTFVSAVKHILDTNQGVILDRSVFSDSVFAVANTIEGNISPEGYEYYKALRAQTLHAMPVPHAIIYLGATPDVCLQRINARSRSCESGIPLSYLELLHEQYEAFLLQMKTETAILPYDWTSFGETSAIVRDLEALAPKPWDSSLRERLLAFVADESAVLASLQMDQYLEEAALEDKYLAMQTDTHRELETSRREARLASGRTNTPSPPLSRVATCARVLLDQARVAGWQISCAIDSSLAL